VVRAMEFEPTTSGIVVLERAFGTTRHLFQLG
jgi:hypothetical protein